MSFPVKRLHVVVENTLTWKCQAGSRIQLRHVINSVDVRQFMSDFS